ncbi:Ger(x)C family spore germination C-terminal domain-containing protein, partial [Peribacillus sp. NPDC060186]
KNYEVYESKVNTTREAKNVFDSSSNGLISTGKLQMILLSESLLKKEGAMPYLDVWYRDPKNTGNMRVVAVKGSIASIVNSEFKDKPMLPEYLTNVIDVNKQYNHTSVATFLEFHRQTFNRGVTPAISEIIKGKNEIVVTGTALLNNRGIYKMSLNRRESALLLMLQKKGKLPISLTISMPSVPFETKNTNKNVKNRDFVTININRINRDLSTGYNKNHFSFDVKMKLNISITERTFNMNMEKDQEKLAKIITEGLNRDLNSIIQKVQSHKLDPFGFGEYARAFQYQHWKKIENDWPAEFSSATVKVTPIVKISEAGIIK